MCLDVLHTLVAGSGGCEATHNVVMCQLPRHSLSARRAGSVRRGLQCSVDRSRLECVSRTSHVDVERGDVFQSCEEHVQFVGRRKTLAVNALREGFMDHGAQGLQTRALMQTANGKRNIFGFRK